VATVLRRHGIPVQNEPNFYTKHYQDGVKHRPDLIVWTATPVATDFVVVQQDGARPGAAAGKEAEKKTKHHNHAVVQAGHIFVPFALETHGYAHPGAMRFINEVSQHLPAYEAEELRREATIAVSTTLARARVHAVAAILQQRDRVMMDNNEGEDMDATLDIAAGLSNF
jgi:hypothetical protein